MDVQDFNQARALLYMRIKLDSGSQGQPPHKREEARNKFLKLYDGFPFQVIWLYLKRIRFMKHGCTMVTTDIFLKDSKMPADLLFGKEDVIAQGKYITFVFHS
jgi:hypothetical protein